MTEHFRNKQTGYEEFRTDFLGIPGRLKRLPKNDALWTAQTFDSDWRAFHKDTRARLELSFDDRCGNGHNTFHWCVMLVNDAEGSEEWTRDTDTLQATFPELSEMAFWDDMTSVGPIHYPRNPLFFAGDADCFGRRLGEPERFESFFQPCSSVPMLTKFPKSFLRYIEDQRVAGSMFTTNAIAYKGDSHRGFDFRPKYSVDAINAEPFAQKWHDCPFDSQAEAAAFAATLNTCDFLIVEKATAFSKGKNRELDAARRTAFWPDATDDELMLPRDVLEAKLLERLPALIDDFRQAIMPTAFYWTPEDARNA